MVVKMIGAPLVIAALQQATLTGVVRDSVDLQPIAFAQVTATAAADGATPVRGVADQYGAFFIPGLPSSSEIRVVVRAAGHTPWQRSYEEVPSDPIRVLLERAPIALQSLEVTGNRGGDPIALSRDAFVFDSVLIRSLPPILESDVLRATVASPSASAPSDYSSVPFIRGGASAGTPVMLDGVRLFNAVHLGGFVSAVNAEVVERASLLAGSGGDGLVVGSLSGAIDIATRDGSRERRRVSGSLGVGSSRLALEGPIGDNVSYLLDGRRTYIGAFTTQLEKYHVVEDDFPYYFQDVHSKLTFDLGGVRRLSVSGYASTEDLTTYDATETLALGMQATNIAFSGHFRGRLGASGIVDATVGYSRFANDLEFLGSPDRSGNDEEGDTADIPREILLYGEGSMEEARADLRLTWRAKVAAITVGAQAIRFVSDHDYDATAVLDWDDDTYFAPLSLRRSHLRLASYASADIDLTGGYQARTGVRADHFNGFATTVGPFAELGYADDWWSARISASQSYQELASVRNEEALTSSFLAYDILVPVTKGPMPRNTEASIGWQGTVARLRIRVDAYARWLANLRLPDPGRKPLTSIVMGDPNDWYLSEGKARGLESSWSWHSETGVALLGSYRWATVSRRVGAEGEVDGPTFGEVYWPRFHRNHELELGASYRRGASLWSVRYSLRSGQPVTPSRAIAPFQEQGWDGEVQLLSLGGSYNSATLPFYRRIDLGWRYESDIRWFGGGSVSPYVSVANLLNSPNVVGWVVQRGWYSANVERVYMRQLPMLPFAGVEFRF